MKEWLIEREFKVLESSVRGRTAVSHSFDEDAANLQGVFMKPFRIP
jgi:hypothetical protein